MLVKFIMKLLQKFFKNNEKLNANEVAICSDSTNNKYQQLDRYLKKQENNIITLCTSKNHDVSAGKVQLDTVEGQIGNDLNADTSNYKITIGEGIKYAEISATVQGYSSNTPQIAIYKNGKAIKKAYNKSDTYSNFTISNFLIPVVEGDYFELYVVTGTVKVSTGLTQANNTHLTIKGYK